ncbi:hypothetical protein, partial [Planomonospora algeriensis]
MSRVRQGVGVGEGQSRRPRLRTLVTQFRQPLKGDDRGVLLAEIPAGAGFHDGHFNLPHPVEALGLLGPGQIESPFRAPETALAVRHDRQERLGPRHPAGGTQIAERLREVPGPVGGDADGLADHTDPGGEATGDLGVLVRLLGVLLSESPLRRHQVTGDQIGEIEGKGAQLLADLLVELFRGDVRSERRQFLTLSRRSLVVTATARFITAVATAGAAFTAEPSVTVTVRSAARTVVPVERTTLPTTVVPIPVPATTRPVIPTERRTITPVPRTVLTPRLIPITVRTLTTTIITV